jgi:hypothetical protein
MNFLNELSKLFFDTYSLASGRLDGAALRAAPLILGF